jgi:hypothetical protein
MVTNSAHKNTKNPVRAGICGRVGTIIYEAGNDNDGLIVKADWPSVIPVTKAEIDLIAQHLDKIIAEILAQ